MFNSEQNKLAFYSVFNRRCQTAVFTLPVNGAATPTPLELKPGLYMIRCPDGVPGKSIQLAFGHLALATTTSLPSAGAGFKDVVSIPSNVWATIEIEEGSIPVVDWDGGSASTLVVTKIAVS